MSGMTLEVIWTDDDEMMQVGISLWSRKHSAYHETFLYPENISKFAEELMGFPETSQSEVVLKVGSRDPSFTDFIQIRAFVYKSNGHSALEIDSEVRGDPSISAKVHFYVPGFPADFNRLGAELHSWTKQPTSKLTVEWQDA